MVTPVQHSRWHYFSSLVEKRSQRTPVLPEVYHASHAHEVYTHTLRFRRTRRTRRTRAVVSLQIPHRWKAQKKSKGCLWTCTGFGLPLFVIMLVIPISDLFGQTAGMLSLFGGLGISVVLAVMGIAKMASAATSMPPGVVPPPGYTNHTSSYYGGTCSSSQGNSGDSGDSGGGGCGGGCGGGD